MKINAPAPCASTFQSSRGLINACGGRRLGPVRFSVSLAATTAMTPEAPMLCSAPIKASKGSRPRSKPAPVYNGRRAP